MNAPFSVAQAPSSGTTAGTRTLRTIKVGKPQGDQAVTVQLGYEQDYKLDLSAIANEKITLVHIGEKLIILFDNKSTVTVEPFFDSMNAPLSNVTVEAGGRNFSSSEFASAFPITTDQSVLTAAGVAGVNSSPASGANFNGASVDPLDKHKPLDLLGQEELPNWKVGEIPTVAGLTAAATAASFDDHPTARADSNWVRENSFSEGPGGSSASGNVLVDQAHNGAPAGTFADVADSTGADGFGSLAWTGETGGHVAGTYGTLTVDANGHYTYVVDNSNATVKALANGTLTDTFTYTITDSDGDTDTATLTVTIFGTDHIVTITGLTPSANGGDASVNEANLSDGSAHNTAALTQPGTFNISAPDGLDDLTVGGHAVITNGVFTTTSFTTALGNTLSFTGFNPGTGEVSYTYTLGDNAGHAAIQGTNSLFENFTVELSDVDGSTASNTLSIRIVDDVPTAHNDTDSVTENGVVTADGNVITGIGGSDANATDGAADTAGADGIASIAWAGQAGNTVAGAHGTLTVGADGSYTYTLASLDPAVVALGNGDTLNDTFSYTITDSDGDTSPATLTITINGSDDGVTITDLTPSANGGDATVNEANLSDGSSPNTPALTQPGTFTISAPDGVDDLTVGGHAVITNGVFTPVSFATGLGNILNFTGFNPGTGEVTYSYTLGDHEVHAVGNGTNNLFDSLTIVLTDIDGSTTSNTLSIRIIDDVPTAHNDIDSVKEDGPLTADGNVITGVGGFDGNLTDGNLDTAGADGIASIAWAGQTGNTVAGAHGTLTVGADGSYNYALTNSDRAVQGLSNGETLTETFSYTVTDSDGDTSPATLTITFNGTDDGVTITNLTAQAQGGDVTVNEANLSDGSTPNTPALTQPGTFNISTPDGLDDLTVGGHAVITNGVFATSSFTTALGNTLVFTGFDPATGQISYTYTLNDNEAHASGNGTNSLFEDFAVVLTDVDGSSATNTLSVNIVDDVPTARNDFDSVNVGVSLVADGNVLTGIGGSDANATDGVADSAGADGILFWTGSAGGSLIGHYGTISATADGSYTYVVDGSNADVLTLANGATLTETFDYSITDADGDRSDATLTIAITGSNHGVTITNLTSKASGGDASVSEDDLLAGRGVGEAAGSDTTKESTTQGGTFNISTPDGLDDLTVGGHAVITNGVFTATSFTTAFGNTLTFTGFNAGTGEITYTYTLLDNETHAAGSGNNSLFEDFAVVLTDTDGSPATNTLSINIVDDVPTAVDDVDSVTEDGSTKADGNVITGIGGSDTNTTDGQADTAGADGITSIAWTGATGGAVAGVFGTLTVTGLGNYSYALDNSNAVVQGLSSGETLTETFNYTITDADGDTSPAKLTITINGSDDGVTITNLTPASDGGDVTVNENDLLANRGAGEAEGSDTSKESTTQTGTFNINTPDGLDDLSIGGHAVITNGVFTATSFTTPLGNTLAVTGFIPATGEITYSYTLLDNETHAPVQGNNSLFEDFAVVLTDVDGSPATNTLSVNIVDDAPVASAVTKSLVATGHDTNLMLILDISGSMADPSGLTGLTQLDVLKASVNELFEQYGDLGNVSVRIVTFSSTAAQAGSTWMTLSDAKAFVAGLAAGGNTDYDAAVAAAQSAYSSSGKIATAGVQNISYFMSDGVPNEDNGTGSNGIVGTEITAWQNFLNTNSINSFSLGIGAGATQGTLDPLAFNGASHTDTNAIIVTDLSQLTTTLVGTVSAITGNLLTDGILPNSFGADGGYIKSVSIDGTTYTYDPSGAGSITVTGTTPGSFDASTHKETIAISTGATFTIDMDDGAFSYVAPANVPAGFNDVIQYLLADNDGDTAPNSLTVVVSTQDHHPVVRDDKVITNITGGSGTTITIPDYALLFNDSDPEGQTVSITGAISNITGANTVTHSSGSVSFVDDGTAGGSFTYTGSTTSPTALDTGIVTVDRAQSGDNTLDGTGLGDILIARNNNTTINGDAGNDVLIGGTQNDSLVGGTGNDLMVGGAGNDTYFVDSVGDQIVENAGEGTADTVQSTITFSLASLPNVENLTLTGSANIDATGNDANNILTGNSGNNTITGGLGNDSLVGGSGNDTYVFGLNDGTDTINDSNGTDSILVLSGGGTLTGFNATASGNNLVLAFNGESVTVTNHFSGSNNVESLTFSGGATFNGVDLGSSPYTLVNDNSSPFTGTTGNDIIAGSSGNQSLVGDNGNDLMFGNGGNDTLNGGAGNDLLIGGTGNDSLIGGTGTDRFVFAAGDTGQTTGNIDVISDYAKGVVGIGDVIDYSNGSLTIGGSSAAATSSQASINATTGVATFASGSGTSLADAISDIASSINVGGTTQGEFALFKVNGTGDFHLFVSDNVAGVSANDLVIQLFGVSTIGSVQLNNGDLTIAA